MRRIALALTPSTTPTKSDGGARTDALHEEAKDVVRGRRLLRCSGGVRVRAAQHRMQARERRQLHVVLKGGLRGRPRQHVFIFCLHGHVFALSCVPLRHLSF